MKKKIRDTGDLLFYAFICSECLKKKLMLVEVSDWHRTFLDYFKLQIWKTKQMKTFIIYFNFQRSCTTPSTGWAATSAPRTFPSTRTCSSCSPSWDRTSPRSKRASGWSESDAVGGEFPSRLRQIWHPVDRFSRPMGHNYSHNCRRTALRNRPWSSTYVIFNWIWDMLYLIFILELFKLIKLTCF